MLCAEPRGAGQSRSMPVRGPSRRVFPTDATRRACYKPESAGSSVAGTRDAAVQTTAGRRKHPRHRLLKSFLCRELKNRDKNFASRLRIENACCCAAHKERIV